MVFITPYATYKCTTYKGDGITTRLSMAIWLIDDFTGEKATGNIRVVIKEIDKHAIKNLSGYYIFTDLADDEYFIDIFSDLYVFHETKIDTSKIKVSNLSMEFDPNGPASGAISTKIKDASRLQKDDIIEFSNSSGDVEQKTITDIENINASTGTISWAEKLEHDYSAAGSTILVLKNPVVTIHLNPLPSYPFPNKTTLIRGLIIDSNKNPVAKASLEVESQNIGTESDENGEFVLYFNNIENNQIQIDIEKNENTGTSYQILEEGKTKYLKIVYIDGQFTVT